MAATDPITRAVSAALTTDALPALVESAREEANFCAQSDYRDDMSFGFSLYRNRLNRLNEIAGLENSFRSTYGNESSVIYEHAELGEIKLFFYNAREPDLLPANGAAKSAKRHAAKSADLFSNDVVPSKGRHVAVVADPHMGVKRIVVGLLEELPNGNYELRNRIELDVPGNGTDDGTTGTPPPEPETGPILGFSPEEEKASEG